MKLLFFKIDAEVVNPKQNSNLSPSQEQKTNRRQATPKRVSFPLAGKNPG